MDKCVECGGELQTKQIIMKQKVSEKCAYSLSYEGLACTACTYPNMTLNDGLLIERAVAKKLLEDGIQDGASMKFCRKAYGLTRDEVGKALDVDVDAMKSIETAPYLMDYETFHFKEYCLKQIPVVRTPTTVKILSVAEAT
jgi:hypothetical protein